jgi:multiple sugar transport system substrate-binding protein
MDGKDAHRGAQSERNIAMAISRKMLFGLTVGFGMVSATSAFAVEIDYWQYVFDARIKAMDQLIKNFEAANPDITVKQTTFPYADYQTKVAAAITAGQGPDVVQFYYGWLDNFRSGKLIQPLPQDAFPHDQIEKDFFPIISAMKYDNEYWGLPTAVRSLALFYNKNMFKDAGLDPNTPPATLDDLVADAVKTTKTDGSGNITTEGLAVDMGAQDHQWWREVLVRQFGGVPYTDDYRKVTYDDEHGLAALKFYTDLQTVHKVGKTGFMDEAQAAFKGNRAAMIIDGSFRLGSFSQIKDFEWGVAELPSHDGVSSNYVSYWVNGLAANSKGDKLKAAEKFLAYVTSPEAMDVWLKTVGELPAKPALALTPENVANPIYGPFLKGLKYGHTTLFVDESAQRQTAIDMVNRVLLQNQDPKASLDEAAKAEQDIIDEHM